MSKCSKINHEKIDWVIGVYDKLHFVFDLCGLVMTLIKLMNPLWTLGGLVP